MLSKQWPVLDQGQNVNERKGYGFFFKVNFVEDAGTEYDSIEEMADGRYFLRSRAHAT